MIKDIIFTFSLLLLYSSSSIACVCSDFNFHPDLSETYLNDSSYLYVTAEVTKIKKAHNKPLNLMDRRYHNKVTLRIIKYYNSKPKVKKIKVRTGAHPGGDCGFPFKIGEEYFVTYTKYEKRNKQLWTSICVPTKPLVNAEKDIILLTKYLEK